MASTLSEGSGVGRLTADDLTALVTDTGGAPMQIGAVLELAPTNDDQDLLTVLRARLAAVERLRQRLWRPPLLCGRPLWVDDPVFDVDRHVATTACPGRGTHPDLLALAAALAATPLPRDRPLWQATLVTGLDDGTSALVVVLHHVLADGLGGLAVLGALADEGAGSSDEPVLSVPAPRPVPPWWRLLADAMRERATRLGRLRRVRPAVRQLAAALRAGRPALAPRTSLNHPTGLHRSAEVVAVPLDAARTAAHVCGATVNDVLLVAVGGALGRVARRRGERLPQVVISVPVAQRPQAHLDDLGNQVGVVPVTVPTSGDLAERLATTAQRSRLARSSTLAGSPALGLCFRLLARLRLFRFLIDHQRLVTTFVTNLHGPPEELHVAGRAVQVVVPLSVVTGNVTVAFAALSYAGRLGITVISDPEACPDAPVVAAALCDELGALLALGGSRAEEAPAGAPTSW